MLKFKRETELKDTKIGEIPRDWGVREKNESFSAVRIKMEGGK